MPGDGYCIAADIGCTLRAAVQEANAFPGTDTINILPGTYRLQIPGADEAAAAGDLDVTDSVTIRCDGAEPCIVEAGASANLGIDRVFDIRSGAVRLENLTVRHGNAPVGGGIQVVGAQLVLAGVHVTDNWASANGAGSVSGGGISLSTPPGQLTLTDSQVTANDLVIRDGQDGYGAGIRVFGDLPIDIAGSELRDNGVVLIGSARSAQGGGLYGRLKGSMTDSVVSGNRITCSVSSTGACNTQGAGLWIYSFVAHGTGFDIRSSSIEGNTAGCQRTAATTCQVSGGGLYVAGGTVAITDSAIAENEAASAQSLESRGGGIHVAGATVTLDNSTLSGNVAAAEGNRGYGGAIYVEPSSGVPGIADLAYTTIAANTADWGAAFAVTDPNSSISVKGSIIASAAGAEGCWGAVKSEGFNVFSDTSCGTPGPADQLGVDPGLGDLADNGGATRTHALLGGSPAVDAAGESSCSGHALLVTDQRGFPRPADGDGDGTAVCDIGAYEAAAPPAPTPTATASPTLTVTPRPSATPSATANATPSWTATPTRTASPFPSATPAASHTPTRTPAVALTPTATRFPAVGLAGSRGSWQPLLALAAALTWALAAAGSVTRKEPRQ
ncbi:MAG: hypothetical protein HYV63_04775 [Candidatus Schekmanbacteria bacterium]|nr:hypothetical protein [Candidatus Schekmanbacteria bacterium]